MLPSSGERLVDPNRDGAVPPAGRCLVSLGEGNVPGGWTATSGAQSLHPAETAAHLCSAVWEVSQQCYGTAAGTPWHQERPQLLQEGEELKF